MVIVRNISSERRTTAHRISRSNRRLPACVRVWRRIMSAQFRRAGVRARANPQRRGARPHRERLRRARMARRKGRVRLRERSRRRAAALVRLHRHRRQRPARRIRKGAAPRSPLRLPTGMDSGRLRRRPTMTLPAENRARRLTDRLLDNRADNQNVPVAAATGTGLRRVRQERAPAARIPTATGAAHLRVRSWICGSRSCAVRLLAAIVRRATVDHIARPVAVMGVPPAVVDIRPAADTAAAVAITNGGRCCRNVAAFEVGLRSRVAVNEVKTEAKEGVLSGTSSFFRL